MLALFVPALLWLPPTGWTLLCAVLSGWAAWEWARLARLKSVATLAFAAAVVLIDALMLQTPGINHAQSYYAAAAFWIVAAPLLLKFAPKGPPGLPAWGVLLMGLVALPAVFLAMVLLRAFGSATLVVTMGIVWISDSLAYFTGRSLGRHKLAPKISPGKSWEGAAGGMLAVAVYAAIIHTWPPAAWGGSSLVPWPLAWTLLLYLLLGVAGIVGDLTESLLKRWAGVKDSGKALPGHGGILDRVDALLPVLPLAALAYLHG